MKVEELIIDGFKSYATRTVISGWDPQFNAITGLNGSGKSNILDAICFVLGISSMTTVRASNLQDLIYKRGQAGVTKASVTIVFDNSEVSKLPIGFESCSKISVTRQIVLGGNSKYLINGHKAQQQTVLNLFQSVQLNINNPNFLIMQGKITKVLNMKPSETLLLIEEASGTRTFEDRRLKAEKTMQKKDQKLKEIRTLLDEEIKPKLDKLKHEKSIYMEFQEVQTKLEKSTKILLAYNYQHYLNRFNHESQLLNENEEEERILNDLTNRLTSEISSLKDDLAVSKKKREQEMIKDGKIKQLEAKENELSNNLTRATTSKDIINDNIKEEMKSLEKLKEKLKSLSDKESSNLESSSLEDAYKRSKEQLIQLKDDYNRKEELLSTLSTGVSLGGEGGYLSQVKDAKERLNESQNKIQSGHMKIDHLRNQLQSNQERLHQAKAENQNVLQKIENDKVFIQKKENELKAIGYDHELFQQLKSEDSSLNDQLRGLNQQLSLVKRELNNNNVNSSNLEFHCNLPHLNSKLVKGIVASLFTLTDLEKAFALQVCAGGRLYNVIVDNASIALDILERGQLKKRVTIIPLDKIQSRLLDTQMVEYAKLLRPQKVDLALNLIKFEDELHKAMEYVFGTTFIVKDPEAAKTITFDPKIRSRSITLDGDIYDPEGNLSGGSRKNSTAILVIIQKYNKIIQSIGQIEQELASVRNKLQGLSALSMKSQPLIQEIQLKRHELQLAQKMLESNPSAQIVKQYETIEKEIANIEQEVERENSNSIAIQKEIASIEKDMSEFNSNKKGKLKQLTKEVAQLKVLVQQKDSEVNETLERFQNIQMELDLVANERKVLEDSIANGESTIADLNTKFEATTSSIAQYTEELKSVQGILEEEKANLFGITEEILELTKIIKVKEEEMGEAKLNLQKTHHELEKLKGAIKHVKRSLDDMIGENDWITDDRVVSTIIQQNPNANVHEIKEQQQVLQDRFQNMRRKVNSNIMNMIENVENKETALKTMVRTIGRDRTKIVNTIEKLNGYKRDTLNKTYKRVSTDFGNIFADLLPGSFAKLVPVDDEDVTKGLDIKVKLGQVWKESLVELSGGQRSLIALSLIMALLQFKPAPMYILDEVDAALDLSHTQNIGHLIKTRFKGSQFIVVSLKEGMFTNANRVFRTRFQDGTSVVSVM